jgi:hypothetical protein
MRLGSPLSLKGWLKARKLEPERWSRSDGITVVSPPGGMEGGAKEKGILVAVSAGAIKGSSRIFTSPHDYASDHADPLAVESFKFLGGRKLDRGNNLGRVHSN